MGCNSVYFKLGDQLLQSPPHLLLCNTTQRESQSSVLPHRTTITCLGASSMLSKGDTRQPPVQCNQQQGHPLAGSRELAAGIHRMLPSPQEPALLARHWELGHSAWLCHLPQWNTPTQPAKEKSHSARRLHCPRKISFPSRVLRTQGNL